jgi:hypothetical protein
MQGVRETGREEKKRKKGTNGRGRKTVGKKAMGSYEDMKYTRRKTRREERVGGTF